MVLNLLLGVALVPSGVPKGHVTMGELRRMVPADLRSHAGDAAAWPWIQKACNIPADLVLAGPTSGGLNGPEIFADEKNGDTVQGLLAAWDDPKERDLIARTEKKLEGYQPAFEALDEALAFPRWAHPRLPDSHVVDPSDTLQSEDFSVRMNLRKLARAVVLQMRLEIAKGAADRAEQRLWKLRLLGERLCGMGWDDFAYLSGISICNIANRTLRLVAQERLLSDEAVIRLIRHSVAYPIRANLADSWRGELDSYGLATFAAFDDPQLLPGKALQAQWELLGSLLVKHPNALNRGQTMKWLTDLYGAQIANLRQPYSHRVDKDKRVTEITAGLPSLLQGDAFDDDEVKLPSRARQIVMRKQLRHIDNPLGRYMIQMVASGAGYLRAAFAAEARQNLESLAIAAIVYKHRTGTLPASLGELSAADGIDKPLRDPLTDTPFHYDRSIVWSTALNEEGKPDTTLKIPIEIKTPSAPSRLKD